MPIEKITNLYNVQLVVVDGKNNYSSVSYDTDTPGCVIQGEYEVGYECQ